MPVEHGGKFPLRWIHEADDYYERDLGEAIMEFRLTYQGPLYANRGPDDTRQSRLKHMHDIRRNFHQQLAELWKVDARLRWFADKSIVIDEKGQTTSFSRLDILAKSFESTGIRWIPLINELWGIVCGLDILFLRHECSAPR